MVRVNYVEFVATNNKVKINMEEESVCYCEVTNVTHSDTFTPKSSIFRWKGKQCIEVKSYSLTIQKWTRSEQYFFQFKKDPKDKKLHHHELPQVGTALISVECHSDTRIGFEVYRVPQLISNSIKPLLFLTVINTDAQGVEKCLRRSLQVSSYAITDFRDDEGTNNSTIENCILHVTPHYICVTLKTEKFNLKILKIITIADAIVAYKNSPSESSNDLILVISSNDVTTELKFSSILKKYIIEKLKTLKKDLCVCEDEREVESSEGSSELIRECSEDLESKTVSLSSSPSCYPEKVVVLPFEFTPESKPPLVNRNVKPVLKPCVDGKAPLTEGGGVGGSGRCEGVTIRYVNNLYQNVTIKPNGEALKLSVAVFASEPVLTDPWLVEIIFIRSGDFETTFKYVDESQKSCGRHLIAPCRPIRAVTGMVVMLDVSACPSFELQSREQHISYDKLLEISDVSWLVVEKVLTYNGHSKQEVTLLSKLRLVSDPDSVNEEITILQKFRGYSITNPSDSGSISTSASISFPLTYVSRMQFCQLLDLENPTGKDWKYFASAMHVDAQTIKILEMNAREKSSSCSEFLLRHLESHSPDKCHYDYVESVLRGMGRKDLIDVLIGCNEGAVEN